MEDYYEIKKWTAILLSTLMVLGLTACGSQNTQGSQNVQNSVSTAQPAGGSVATESMLDSGWTGDAEEETTEVLTESVTEKTTEVQTDPTTEEMTEEQTELAAEETMKEQTESAADETTEEQAEPAAEEASEPSSEADAVSDTAGKTLVVYYSATGTTEKIANYIAAATGADLFALEPADPYSSDDLNWSDNSSRVVYEHDNPEARVVELEAATVDDWASYDTVFIGYPIWWRIAAWPVDGFVTANDFTGKTVIPFCTSSSSDIGESGELLAEAAGTGNWLDGDRFSSGDSGEIVQAWVDSLGLKI